MNHVPHVELGWPQFGVTQEVSSRHWEGQRKETTGG